MAEELGIDSVTEEELKLAFVIPAKQADMGGCNAYEHVYFLVRDDTTKEQFALGTAEVSEVAWMPVHDVLNALRNVDDGYAPRTQQYVDAMEKELNNILK